MHRSQLFLMILISIVLGACGGGGSGSSTNSDTGTNTIVFNAIPTSGISNSLAEDALDYYQFTLKDNQFYKFILTSSSGDTDLFVFNNDTVLDETTLLEMKQPC